MKRFTVLAFASFLVACGNPSNSDGGADSSADVSPIDAATDGDDAVATGCGVAQHANTLDFDTTGEVTVAGDTGSTSGIFDPSIVYPADAPGGVMSYSTVASRHQIHTRIALSSDHGATWTFVRDANSSGPMSIPSTDATLCPGGQCMGDLVNEVSTLVLDPDDPDPARRWKLFTHRYLVLGGDRIHYELGHIALYTAASPEMAWSEGTPLIGWGSSSSFSSTGVVLDLRDEPNTADCVIASEPAALWTPAGIDLAVTCISIAGSIPEIRIVLLRSTDHARTFHYVSTPITNDDASCLGSTERRVSAPDLFFAGGQEYLIITPDSSTAGYLGCDVLAIDDAMTGAVRRDAMGAPVILRLFDTAPMPRFHGACAYAEGASAMGYVVPIAFLDQPRVFRMFASGVAAP